MRLRIRHDTVYRYARPVRLLDHRLLVSPRQHHDIRLLHSALTIDPAARIVWHEDAAGNSVATALFARDATILSIRAEHELDHRAEAYPIYRLDPGAHRYPFAYDPDDLALIGPALVDGAVDPVTDAWVSAFRGRAGDDTLTLLKALNEEIGAGIAYSTREEEGTRSPAETLTLRSGSCRDLAALFLAAARRLGFAARAASGYLFDPGMAAGDVGATHAWCEVFVPGAGWIAFDPTQRRIGAAGLVATAVGATSEAILPVVGNFAGERTDFVGMTVDVSVTAA
ncbi:hypothetical protein ASG29_00725 [Sphingomonas sp. Leaf412]|uniref:transglutaminase family protein n=1 Tax=Sphingomonas sp. Leaf412 TaxID=1736370 RepID=UPI0006F502DA|nr:transglutaminase family protein [Sphingomonas sp. Leaf412]KQT34723.1 hypothetical protein ASG29_00725 [Sphingomonas sp. Leaf412]